MRGAPLLDRLISKIEHDFLWRTTRELPERGRIGIFNRSYYEEVLIVRVHREILRSEGIPSAPHDDKAVGTTGIVRSWIWRNTSTATEPASSSSSCISLRNRRDQFRLNRRRRQRGFGEARLPLLPLLRLPRSQIRLQVRRCGFLMATRRSL